MNFYCVVKNGYQPMLSVGNGFLGEGNVIVIVVRDVRAYKECSVVGWMLS